ncbi:hypothetical protein IB230_12115 [Pseudoxanthomonas sp. PXM01]|nr:hypothetical protein [Pseudoxanthomonas sp. PXM01]
MLAAMLGATGCSGQSSTPPTPPTPPPSGASQAAQPPQEKNLFRIYDEFVASKAVAAACGVSTPELSEAHDANFRKVAHAVRIELVQKHGAPASDLEAFFIGHDEIIRTRTLDVLKSHPCSTPAANAVIERYRRQSEWQLPTGG